MGVRAFPTPSAACGSHAIGRPAATTALGSNPISAVAHDATAATGRGLIPRAAIPAITTATAGTKPTAVPPIAAKTAAATGRHRAIQRHPVAAVAALRGISRKRQSRHRHRALAHKNRAARAHATAARHAAVAALRGTVSDSDVVDRHRVGGIRRIHEEDPVTSVAADRVPVPPLIVIPVVMIWSALVSVIVPRLSFSEIVLPASAFAWSMAQRSVPMLPSSAALVTV